MGNPQYGGMNQGAMGGSLGQGMAGAGGGGGYGGSYGYGGNQMAGMNAFLQQYGINPQNYYNPNGYFGNNPANMQGNFGANQKQGYNYLNQAMSSPQASWGNVSAQQINPSSMVDPSALINSYTPLLQQQANQDFAGAGARFGRSGMLGSGAYMTALGTVAGQQANQMANLTQQNLLQTGEFNANQQMTAAQANQNASLQAAMANSQGNMSASEANRNALLQGASMAGGWGQNMNDLDMSLYGMGNSNIQNLMGMYSGYGQGGYGGYGGYGQGQGNAVGGNDIWGNGNQNSQLQSMYQQMGGMQGTGMSWGQFQTNYGGYGTQTHYGR